MGLRDVFADLVSLILSSTLSLSLCIAGSNHGEGEDHCFSVGAVDISIARGFALIL